MEPSLPSSDWTSALRRHGLRVTVQRIAVLEFLDLHSHTDAEAIYQGLKPTLSTISPQAVHQIVHDLSAHGLIRRISLPDSTARYETRVEDNHHHAQCIRCGRIEDVDCVVGHVPCLEPANDHGMRILEASVVFRGICKDCDQPN